MFKRMILVMLGVLAAPAMSQTVAGEAPPPK